MGTNVLTLVVDYAIDFFMNIILGAIFSFIGNLFFGGIGDPLS